MEPLVSILIPAFNSERWIAETLRSALGQTWRRKEIIVVDDGSTDRTLAIARQFASTDVAVVSQANQGASAARNKAFGLAAGDYIQWLDADDLLAPDKIACQIAEFDRGHNTRTLLSSSWGRFMYCPDRARFAPTALWCDLAPVEWLIRKMGQNLHMQPATWLVSRELTEAAGPWDTALSLDDDGEYFCRVLLASTGVHFVPDARVYYRMSGFNSLSTVDSSSRKLESLLRSMKAHIATLRSLEDTDRVRLACLEYLHRWAVCFQPHRADLVEQLRQIAADLGGHLDEPRLPWKYRWIQRSLGLDIAKQAQRLLPRLRWSVVRTLDEACYRIGRLSSSPETAVTPDDSRYPPNVRSRTRPRRPYGQPVSPRWCFRALPVMPCAPARERRSVNWSSVQTLL